MNKQEAKTIISTLKKNCKKKKKSLLLKQQSKEKSLQENEWLCLEEIISENSLCLKLDGKLMIIF